MDKKVVDAKDTSELSEKQARELVKDLLLVCETKEELIKYITQSTLELLSSEPDDLKLMYMIGNSLELIKEELKDLTENERIAWNALIGILIKEHSERAAKVLGMNLQRFMALKINGETDD